MKENIRSRLTDIGLPEDIQSSVLYCEGGSARAARKVLGAVYGDAVSGDTYERKYLKRFLRFYKKDSRDCVKALLKTIPDRIHTIIPGMLILKSLASCYRAERVFTAKGGVREGYLWCHLHDVHLRESAELSETPEEEKNE